MFMFWYIVTRLDVFIQVAIHIASVIAGLSGGLWLLWSIMDWRRA